MDRVNALTFRTCTWMDVVTYATEIEKYSIEWSPSLESTGHCNCRKVVGDESLPDGKGYQVVWAGVYDLDLLKLILLHENPTIILAGLSMYYDDPTAALEVRVTEDNYLEHLSKIDFWYKGKKGTYDPILEEL